MQRHRGDQVAIVQKITPRSDHETPERARDVRPIGMLEAKDQAARAVIVAKRRPGPIVDGRISGAAATT
jgi:hypothetical protein